MEQDLWGPVTSTNDKMPVECKFEDSFSPEPFQSSHGKGPTQDDDYIPLGDSSQYLAGLERKLARVQGRTINSRKKESRILIDALAGLRDTHGHMLSLPTSNNADEVLHIEHEHAAHQNTTVDPQGPFGAVLRKFAPGKVALTHEELYQLLEADFLAKIQEAAEEEEGERNSEECKEKIAERDSDKVEDFKISSVSFRQKQDQWEEEPAGTQDDKRNSLDEGEK